VGGQPREQLASPLPSQLQHAAGMWWHEQPGQATSSLLPWLRHTARTQQRHGASLPSLLRHAASEQPREQLAPPMQ